MINLADRVRETTTTTGTGTVNLAGAETGFQTFVDAFGDGAECNYCITDGTDWEVGVGTVTDAAPDTLSRDTIIASSNGGAAVNFAAGDKDVFATASGSILPHWGETFEPSGVATLDIDISGCEALEVVGALVPANDNVSLHIQFSNDGGATFETGASYYDYTIQKHQSGGSLGHAEDGAADHITIAYYIGSDTGEYIAFHLKIRNPASAAIQTGVWLDSEGTDEDGTLMHCFGAGRVKTAEVNNAMRLKFTAGNIESGRVTVYRYPAP